MKRVTILLLALIVLGANEALAWGTWAHRFITYTADKYLEPEVKTKVEHYLGSPMIDHCVWMDQIRKPIRKKDHPNHEAFQAYRPSLRWHHSVVDEKFRVSDKRSKIGSGAMVPNLEKCIDNLKKLSQSSRFGRCRKPQVCYPYDAGYALSVAYLLYRVSGLLRGLDSWR